jgi:hypothetical protein
MCTLGRFERINTSTEQLLDSSAFTAVMEGLVLMCGAVAEVFKLELLHAVNQKGKKRRRKRRCWVRDWISRREAMGPSRTLSNELLISNPDYKGMLRMTPEHFDYLLEKVYPHIVKMDTPCRLAVRPKVKLEVTLRYLAAGNSSKSLEFLFRMPKTTISMFIPVMLKAIKLASDDFFRYVHCVYLIINLFIHVVQSQKMVHKITKKYIFTKKIYIH